MASSNAFAGARVDANLINGWGIAFSPSGNTWISFPGAGMSVIYHKTGIQTLAPVCSYGFRVEMEGSMLMII